MDSCEEDPKYSWIYQKLTKDDKDDFILVNNIAYIIYKRKKIEFYKEKNGNPSEDEIKTFHEIHSMESSLEGLRTEAMHIVSQVLNESLKDQIKEVETKLEATLTSEMRIALSNLEAKVSTGHFDIDAKLSKLTAKGFAWWATNILTGVVITFISTMIFWFGAYAYLGKSLFSDHETKLTPTVISPKNIKLGQDSPP